MISKDGALLGYVTAKAMIGERFPLGGTEEHPLTIFEDIITKSGRISGFSFPPLQQILPDQRMIYPCMSDATDSSSVAGYLNIGDTPVYQQTSLQKTILFIRDLTFVLFIIILFWLACWHVAELGSASMLLPSKLFSVGSIFFILLIGRISLLTTDSLSSIIPQVLQDSQDFSSPYGYGFSPIRCNCLRPYCSLRHFLHSCG